eukprot:gene9345-biopygen22710
MHGVNRTLARAWRGLWAIFGLGGAGVALAWRGPGLSSPPMGARNACERDTSGAVRGSPWQSGAVRGSPVQSGAVRSRAVWGAVRCSPGQPGVVRSSPSPGQPGAVRGSPGQPGAVRGSPQQSEVVRSSPGQYGAARSSPGQPGAENHHFFRGLARMRLWETLAKKKTFVRTTAFWAPFLPPQRSPPPPLVPCKVRPVRRNVAVVVDRFAVWLGSAAPQSKGHLTNAPRRRKRRAVRRRGGQRAPSPRPLRTHPRLPHGGGGGVRRRQRTRRRPTSRTLRARRCPSLLLPLHPYPALRTRRDALYKKMSDGHHWTRRKHASQGGARQKSRPLLDGRLRPGRSQGCPGRGAL